MSENDSVLERVYTCARVAVEKRGADLTLLEVGELTSYTDYFLLVSASSDRRVKTIAEAMKKQMTDEGLLALGVEGVNDGRWALLDFGAFIVHVFFEEVRPLFDLEGLWSDAKRIKLPDEVLDAEAEGEEGGFL